MSSVHDVAQGIHRNARTIGLEPLLNLLQREERDLPVIEDTDKIRWLMLASEIDKHNTSLRFGPDGVLDDTNAAVHRNTGQYIVQRPTLSQSYDVLHDDSAAGGLTFPQTDRIFGGGAQSDGTVGIRLNSDDIQFTEYTVAFWLKMALAENSGELNKKCPIAFLNESHFDMALQTNANAFNTNVLVFYPNGQTITPMPYEFIPNVWQHHILTAKGGEQCVYLDGVKVEFAAGVGQIPIINTTSKRAEIFDHFSRGNSPLADGDKMAWVSICKGIADQDWVTNDYAGKRDFSDDSPVEEITTIPFDGDLIPRPNAFSGLMYG